MSVFRPSMCTIRRVASSAFMLAMHFLFLLSFWPRSIVHPVLQISSWMVATALPISRKLSQMPKKRRIRRQLLEEAFQMSCRTSLELLNHMEHVVERQVKDDQRAQRRIALREAASAPCSSAASASAPNVAASAFRAPRPPAGPPPSHLLKPMPPPPPAPARLPKAPLGPPPWWKPPASVPEGSLGAASASCKGDAGTATIPTGIRAILKPRVKTTVVPRVIPPTEIPASIPAWTFSAVRAPKEEVLSPTTHDEDGAAEDCAEGVVSAPVSVGLAEVLQETEQTIDPKEELFSPISDDGYGVA